MRDRLDSLLDEAARRELNLREALAMLCEAEVAHGERRIQMGMSIARFPNVRTLDGFDFDAQPSLDPRQVRELATCRWVANGDACCCSGRPASARRTWRWRWAGKRSCAATRAVRPGDGVGDAAGQSARRRADSTTGSSTSTQAEAVDRRRAWATCRSRPTRRTCSSSWSRRRYERGSDAGHQQPLGGRVGRRVRRSPWSRPRSSTACCTTATYSRSAATATGSGPNGALAW